VVRKFRPHYLRGANEDDTCRLIRGMLRSIDCMHWSRRNSPFAWQGLYKWNHRYCDVVPEVVADYDLWIWHTFISMKGSHNNMNMLHLLKATNIPNGTILPMASIQYDRHLWRQPTSLYVRRSLILPARELQEGCGVGI
jgi:hypothetical protein